MTVIQAPVPGGVELDVTPLSGTIGAVIRGLDLRDLDDAAVDAIRRVWLERRVVFFPDQHSTPTATRRSPPGSASPPRATR